MFLRKFAVSRHMVLYANISNHSWRIFLYAYLGLILPTIPLMVLGAAIGGAFPAAAVGDVLVTMLSSAGGFGSFVVVVLALTMLGNLAGTMYSITLNFQTLVPWLARVPRYVFSLVVTAIVIPISTRVARGFFGNLENFVGLIGYWSASFVGIVVTEHLVFRKGDCNAYDHAAWNDARLLPPGVAAIAAAILGFGLVIPCMEQNWWVGPIAETTGDIGFEVALVLTPILYVPLRWLERRMSRR